MKTLTLTLLLLSVSSCGALDAVQSVAQDPFGEGVAPTAINPGTVSTTNPWQGQGGGTLYSFEGTPVGNGGPVISNGQGSAAPARGLEGSGDSRPQILDMYADAVSERDNLRLETAALMADLARAEDFITMVEDELDAGAIALAAAQTQAARAEQQTLAIADRLAASELARLQAEERWMIAAIERATGKTPGEGKQ